MLNWNAEHVRLTVFPAHDFRSPDPNWWRTVVGREPQAKTVQQGIGIQESGPFNERSNLSLDLRANRIDWLLAPALPTAFGPLETPTEFPIIGEYAQAFSDFEELLRDWLGGITSIRRIALGVVLTAPVADKVTGYRELAPLLPSVRLDAENSSDFSYSINRHTRSTNACPGLHVNRLSQWGVAQLMRLQIQIDGATVGSTAHERGAEVSAARLQLDINTDADRVEVLPSDRLIPLFNELLSFGRDIAIHGDAP